MRYKLALIGVALVSVVLAVTAALATTTHRDFQESWTEAVHRGLIEGDPAYYYEGLADPEEYYHALLVALLAVDDGQNTAEHCPAGSTATAYGARDATGVHLTQPNLPALYVKLIAPDGQAWDVPALGAYASSYPGQFIVCYVEDYQEWLKLPTSTTTSTLPTTTTSSTSTSSTMPVSTTSLPTTTSSSTTTTSLPSTTSSSTTTTLPEPTSTTTSTTSPSTTTVPPDSEYDTVIYLAEDLPGLDTQDNTLYIGGSVNGQVVIDDVNVKLDGVEVYGAETGPQAGAISVRAGADDVIVTNAYIHDNDGVGMQVRTLGWVELSDSIVEYNKQLGIGGWGVNHNNDNYIGGLVEGNIIRHNNYNRDYRWGWEAGGSKFWSSNGLTVRNNTFSNNIGPGIWFDHDNRGAIIEGNTVFDNTGPGIFWEISYDATIRNNTVKNSGFDQDAWLWGAGITISTSSGVEVYGNTLEGNRNGIGILQQSRGSDYKSYDNVVHDNNVSGGASGVVRDDGDNSVFNRNEWYGNTYDSGHRFAWNNQWGDAAWWRTFHPNDAL